VAQNIALAAASLKLDSLITLQAGEAFKGKRGHYFRERLGFPKGYDFGLAVLLGHSNMERGMPHKQDTSKISWLE
jgi:hypothetical protein